MACPPGAILSDTWAYRRLGNILPTTPTTFPRCLLASGMGKLGLSAFAGAMMYASATVTWTPFHSTLYPYSISQPSSFRHLTVQVAPNQFNDFFYPSVGSSTTNVNVSAIAGRDLPNEVT